MVDAVDVLLTLVEFISCESGQKVRFTNTAVSN